MLIKTGFLFENNSGDMQNSKLIKASLPGLLFDPL